MIKLIYVMSDLHGCYEKYLKMLEKISFSSNDTLYILGDVVDRGDGGIKILQDMMKKRNIIPIMGNHEKMALNILQKVYSELEYEGKTTATVSSSNDCKLWFAHGGFPTYHHFSLLHPKQQRSLLEYIESFSIDCDIVVNGKQFYLAHSALKAHCHKELSKTISNDRHFGKEWTILNIIFRINILYPVIHQHFSLEMNGKEGFIKTVIISPLIAVQFMEKNLAVFV